MFGFGTRLALCPGQVPRPVGKKEDMAMAEDLLVTAGVLVASAVCGWYVVHAISGVVLSIPADDMCTTAAQCLALVGG